LKKVSISAAIPAAFRSAMTRSRSSGRLLADPQNAAEFGRQCRQGRRHNLGEDARALAAAEDQQLDGLSGFGRGIGGCCGGKDRRADRVAGIDRAAAIGGAETGGLGKTGCDAGDARRQQAIGAAEDGVSARG